MRKHKVGDVVKFRKDLEVGKDYGEYEVCFTKNMKDYQGEILEIVDRKTSNHYTYEAKYLGSNSILPHSFVDEFFEDEPIKETDAITVIPQSDSLTVKASETTNISSSIFIPKAFTLTLTESKKELLSKIISNVSILDYDDWLLDDSETNLGECHAKLQDLVSLYNKISSK